ncbi:SUppressor of activated let-60 Ras [Caenorhabditis elegans]|uniref:SUppressor of activated let-60 Ras n=1 Tax=Caenorhabditis elegans TaxID=6239 RepID=Q19096_CAEEL|nr:SUppressor of activated let-60 Ras [Caenorhabditis elegans]CCD68905.1 SUppressor of activated let-60 Ras [Caenorhabditis elegans]|eukprot:NP_741942.1 SUppressor of activated let-60 Ras [Caenorhabditis elegans]
MSSNKNNITTNVISAAQRAHFEESPLMQNEQVIRTQGALHRLVVITVLFLALTQYGYGIAFHSSLMSIQFAASALAFISSIEVLWHSKSKNDIANRHSVFLLYRTAGTVFFIACLFLNLTHCLEDVSDLNSATHSEVGNETESVEEAHEHPIAYHTLYLSTADLVIKAIFSVIYNALSIHFVPNFIALVAPPVLTILIFFYNVNELDYFFGWLNHHLEPVTSILLTIVCISIAIYSLIRKKQFLLAEGPREFKIDDISSSVKAKNSRLEKVDHVHASCEWPQGFTVSLKAYIKVEKTNKDWVAQAASDFYELKALLHHEIKAQGAKEVVVEPVFVDQTELTTDFMDPICISRSCHNEDVGCCTIPKSTGDV